MNFLSSEFGLFAFAKQPRKPSRPSDISAFRKILTQPEYLHHTRSVIDGFNKHQRHSYVSYPSDVGMGATKVENIFVGTRRDPSTGEWF